MANAEPPVEHRHDDGPDVELPGVDVDGSKDFVDDATGASYDEQAERAQDVIDRAHAMPPAGADVDDASAATEGASEEPEGDTREQPL
ncbi:hypothetical protein [Agrococcus sp. Ld7]|uniref:hypothetical protein n=1 Tax=Agrococcus sp. Ld7 TaxID=649148 RepID=UPI0038654401